jgi:L,D-peptidoglycan transpeptidase YkuD (ErfK/YbiS/YcfS/YnhG family)
MTPRHWRAGILGLLAPIGVTVCLLAAAGCGNGGEMATESGPEIQLPDSRQHLVVVTQGPGRIQGVLYRMERLPKSGSGAPDAVGAPDRDPWRQVGPPVPVVVGRSGVGPKTEGDGRAPQGAFPLGPAFGYAPEPPPGLRLPYLAMVPGTLCVDDPASAFYNLVFDPDTLPGERDWASAEAMRRDLAHGDDLYRFGVVVQYNSLRVPGAGSCIFLHLWRSPESPTAGCTAMAEADLLEILRWLDPDAAPLLVQGDWAFLEALREEGTLPYPVPGPGIPHLSPS